MKKMLSVLLALVLAFTCALPAVSLAEAAATPEEEELDAVLAWLLEGITEENASELLTWDEDTILKKLEDYDQPLEYHTKEEIAKQVSVVLEIISLFFSYEEEGSEAAFTRSGGEAMDLSGLFTLFSMLGSNAGADEEDAGETNNESLSGLFSGMLGDETGAEEDSGETGIVSLVSLLFGGMMGGEEDAQDSGEDEMNLSSLFSLFGGMMGGEEDTAAEDDGEETDWSGLLGLFGGMIGGEEDTAAEDDGEEADWTSLLGLFGGMTGNEEDTAAENDGEETDWSGLLGLFGGMTGNEENTAAEDDGEETDWASLLGLFGGMMGDEEDTAAENDGEETDWASLLGLFGRMTGESDESSDWSFEEDGDTEVIDGNFDGTHWISGDMTLDAVYQDGYYNVVITDGDTELYYQCVMDPETWDKVSAGTGDPATDETQPDHGVATFYQGKENSLIWKKADGEEVIFLPYTDPLNGTGWFAGEKQLTIFWLGQSNFEVDIDDGVNYWYYECVLDEASDTLEGVGMKGSFEGGEYYADAQTLFAFQKDRTELVWLDEKEEDALDGLTFEIIDPLLVREFWDSDDYGIFITWTGGYYDLVLHNYESGREYGYLCTYDRENGILTAADPATIDFDSLTAFGERDAYASTATFVLVDGLHLIWLDDSGASGSGVVLDRLVWE